MRAFLGNDRGSATLEILAWLPLLVELVLVTADVSLMYWRHAEMWHAARDTVRQTVAGSFDSGGGVDASAVEAYARDQLTDRHSARYFYDPVTDRHGVAIEMESDAMSLIGNVAADFGTVAVSFVMDAER